MLQVAPKFNSAPEPRGVITDDEVAQFERDGFVQPAMGLSIEDAGLMREAVERVFVDNPGANDRFIVRMPHLPIDREGQIEGLIGGEALFQFAMHPLLIAAASRLIGPNLMMWDGEIFSKSSTVDQRTPWHQDYERTLQPGPGRKKAKSAMIWIAVDDVDPDNGSLRFIPGSGRGGAIDHARFEQSNELINFEADISNLEVERAHDSHRRSGQFSAHDLYVVHGANANRSGRRRVGLAFHYMAAEDLYDRSFGNALGSADASDPVPMAGRPIWLVLGENRHEQNDFVTGHRNLEDLDHMAESVRKRLTPLFNQPQIPA